MKTHQNLDRIAIVDHLAIIDRLAGRAAVGSGRNARPV